MPHGPVDSEHRRRAQLASVREDLLAPVSALVGYGQLLLEEGARRGLDDLEPDLLRILTGARELAARVDRLLEDVPVGGASEVAPPAADGEAIQKELRHELRTPLSGIMGYAELLLEELEGDDAAALRPDLDALLAEARSLLERLDDIVDLTRGDASTVLADGDTGAVAEMVSNLVRTVRPDAGRPVDAAETGRILVVDDNASTRDLLVRRLTRDGHDVAVADSGRDALERLAEGNFDVVLLDLLMPDLNGLQVLQRMKADDEVRDVSVIITSALEETDSVARCIEAGAEDYLPKTFDPVLLRARIAACLERKRWRDKERLYLDRIEEERSKHEALLRNILPGQIVTRLSEGEVVIADRVEEATVIFADLVGFTEIAVRLTPTDLIDSLNRLFSRFDSLCGRMGIEKIKTIGDAYMAAAGLPEPRPDHAKAATDFAFAMLRALDDIRTPDGARFEVRIGMATGPVIAGVIGAHKFIYDVWGGTVNLASRLEAQGAPGRVHVSGATRDALAGAYDCERRGVLNIKGLGEIETWFVRPPEA